MDPVTITCACPAKADGSLRHPDGDQITLRERLDFRGAVTVRNAIQLVYGEDPNATLADVLAALTEQYVLLGIEAWTLVDEAGKPVPVTKAAIRDFLQGQPDSAMTVGDHADLHYSDQVLRPLLNRASASSPASPTDDSTSASKPSPTPLPKQSRPSSTTTSQTVDIGTTTSAPGGGSSFSQRSASAA